MPSLHIIVGLNSISFLAMWAITFLTFLNGVSDRLLWVTCANGLYFGAMSSSLLFASVAQACRFLQPFSLSLTQSMQMHIWDRVWTGLSLHGLNLLVSLIKSTTDFAECLFNRHFVFTFVRGHGAAPGWYHASRDAWIPGDILIATRLVLYFFPMQSILLILGFQVSALGPLIGGVHICRKVFTMAIADVLRGAVVLIRTSVALAHSCLEGVRLR